MADISQARLLGGVGSVMLFLSIVPSIGFVLSIVGFILVLLALKYISEAVQQGEIFRNALIATVVGIVGAVAGVVAGGVGLLAVLGGGAGPSVPNFGLLLTTILISLAVVWVFAVVSSFFLRKSLNLVGDTLGIKMFRTAGLLLFIGALLTIVLVGALVALVAYILLAVAFFQIQPGAGAPSPPPPPPPP
ncbi:MAG: DUF996 domain-containing protein [Candidatus Caldarchaeum sp.]